MADQPMPSKDVLRAALIEKLKWLIVGSDATGPRPVDDQVLLLDWVDRGIDALSADPDGFEAVMLRGVFNGDFEFDVRDGQVVFRLTAKGHELANNALMNDAEMRHFYQSLAKGAAVDQPKRKQ